MKDWNLLKDKAIISLMIGDEKINKSILFQTLIMPYMSGKDICDFANLLGLNIIYNEEKSSRKEYMERVLDYSIKNSLINRFFKELFELKRFRKVCSEISTHYGMDEMAIYWNTIYEFMNSINKILLYSKCYIEYNLENFNFSLIDNDKQIVLCTETIENIDNNYIKKLQEQALDVIKSGDYNSAITKSRTMLEEVLIYGIEEKGLEVDAKGNIIKLYNQFKSNYNLNISSGLDNRVNDLISGFNKIVDSVARMRDLNSDSHGAGTRRIAIDHNVAVLYVNSAVTLSNFFLSLVEKNKM